MGIAGRTAGPGHYVAYWRWSGYYDCVDVNVHAAPLDLDAFPIGGFDTQQYLWNRVDHCQFVEPQNILTQCLDASDGRGARACREQIEATYAYPLQPVEILQNTFFQIERAGIAQLRPRILIPAGCSAVP